MNGRAEEDEIFNSFALLVLCLQESLLHLTFVAIFLFYFESQSEICLCVEGRKRDDLGNVRIITNGRL